MRAGSGLACAPPILSLPTTKEPTWLPRQKGLTDYVGDAGRRKTHPGRAADRWPQGQEPDDYWRSSDASTLNTSRAHTPKRCRACRSAGASRVTASGWDTSTSCGHESRPHVTQNPTYCIEKSPHTEAAAALLGPQVLSTTVLVRAGRWEFPRKPISGSGQPLGLVGLQHRPACGRVPLQSACGASIATFREDGQFDVPGKEVEHRQLGDSDLSVHPPSRPRRAR